MRVVEEVAASEGIAFGWQEAGGGSDANFTAAAGIPSLDGLGPQGGGFPAESEFLMLDSVAPRIRLLQGVLARLAG